MHLLPVIALFVLVHQVLSHSGHSKGHEIVEEKFQVTSNTVCLESSECLPNFYCENRNTFRCIKRVPLNGNCSYYPECEEGLDCPFRQSTQAKVCSQPTPIGGSCTYSRCVPDAYCSINNKCRKLRGRIGAFCVSDNECRQDQGFFCDGEPGRCLPKKAAGTPCKGVGFDSSKCAGFCSGGFPLGGASVCMPVQKVGQPCRSDRHCQGDFYPEMREGKVVCNIGFGALSGICALESALRKKLGSACNLKKDMCDGRRSLSCEWDAVAKRGLCKQGVGSSTSSGTVFCTPENRLSVCEPSTAPRECRRVSTNSLYTCEIVKKSRKHGERCNPKLTFCEAGTSCLGVPFWDEFARDSFCVKLKGAGKSCGNQFRSQCRSGMSCINGKCVKRALKRYKETHISVNSYCDDLPCVPGLICKKISPRVMNTFNMPTFEKRCVLPARVRKRGESCADFGQFRNVCPKGLACTRDKNYAGGLRCRTPREVGEACETDDNCRGKLKCAQSVLLPYGICINKSLSIGLGSKCDPEAGPGDRRCSRSARQFSEELACLPKGKGYACHTVGKLFDRCSSESNRACAGDGLVCNAWNVCVPK